MSSQFLLVPYLRSFLSLYIDALEMNEVAVNLDIREAFKKCEAAEKAITVVIQDSAYWS